MFAAGIFACLSVALAPAPIEIPFTLADDAIIVEATVNNRRVSLMFDTGFSGAVVLNSAINVGKPDGQMTLRDFVGEFVATTTKVSSLKLGAAELSGPDMQVVQGGMSDLSLSYNTHTDGILGYQPFVDHVLEINFENSKFVLHPKTLDISTRTPDNQRTFLSRMLPRGRGSIDMEVVMPNNKKMVLSLDTGNAFYATTHKDVLERVEMWPPDRKPQFFKQSFVASGAVDSWYKHMRDVKIYGIPVERSVWSIIDLPSSSAEGDGTIGFGFLKNFNIIIDYQRRRVWMENFTGTVQNELPGDIGLIAVMDPKTDRARIVYVSSDGPAYKAGIRRGDDLLSLDGAEVRDRSFRRLNKRLEGPVGSTVKLVVSRNGQLMRYEVERAALAND